MSTHAELVKLAADYARDVLDCGAVIVEQGEQFGEQCDVYGVSRGYRDSCVIECKATVQDFTADAKKRWRQDPGAGMGAFRWFLCDEDVIFPDAVRPPWGLLYRNPDNSISEIIEPVRVGTNNRHMTKELMLLAYAPRATRTPSKGSRHSTAHQAFLDAVVSDVLSFGPMYASAMGRPDGFKTNKAVADWIVKQIESGRETRIRTYNLGGRPMLAPRVDVTA